MKHTSRGASAPSQFISAIFNSTTPEGLKLTEFEWKNEYRGTEAAFIKSGIIKPDWIPGQPGNAARKVRVGIVDGEMRVLPPRSLVTDYQFSHGYICITKSSKGSLIVSVYCLEQERERREEIGYLERKKKRIEEACKEIDKSLAELPSSPAEFIRRELHTIRMLGKMVRTSLIEGFGYSGGYVLPSDVVEEFDNVMDRFHQMINDAPIDFNQKKRQEEIVCIKKRVLEKHMGLTEQDIEP